MFFSSVSLSVLSFRVIVLTQLCPSLCNPLDCSSPSSSEHRILQEECWNELSFSPPRDLPDPGFKPASLTLQTDFLPLSHQGSPSGKPIREARHGNAGFIKCSEVFPLLHIFMLLICVFLSHLKELLLGFLIGHVWWLQIPSAFVGLGKSLSLLHFFMIAFLGKVFLVVVCLFVWFFFLWIFWIYNPILSWDPNPNLHKISADKFADSHIKIPSYVMILSCLAAFKIFSVSLIFESFTTMHPIKISLGWICLGIFELLTPIWPYLSPDLKVFPIIFLNKIFASPSLLPGFPKYGYSFFRSCSAVDKGLLLFYFNLFILLWLDNTKRSVLKPTVSFEPTCWSYHIFHFMYFILQNFLIF